jgi:hypothetical protein
MIIIITTILVLWHKFIQSVKSDDLTVNMFIKEINSNNNSDKVL